MQPKVLKIDTAKIDPALIMEAARAIRDKKLVAFPTETVYGLGADALDPEAVTRIFEAKKRPLDDPLIVHIAERGTLSKLSGDIPPEADALIDRFWPGPLTLVLKKTDAVPDIVTTGLDTVAVRMPSHPVARELILTSGTPIAAPSANLFGRPSPTTARHVVDDLDGAIEMVLDSGKTQIGIESTVVEILPGAAAVLRPGGIDIEDIKKVIPKVRVYTREEALEKSPGKYPQHYAPNARVIVVEDSDKQIEEAFSLASKHTLEGLRVGVMVKEEHAGAYEGFDIKVLGPGHDVKMCASELFHTLREFDKDNVDVIIAEGIPETGIGLAVMNRLRKASG